MKTRRLFLFASLSMILLPYILLSGRFATAQSNGITERVSIALDGTQGNGSSNSPSISADGRYIAYYSYASNLVSNDTNNTYDVFVRDRLTGQTTRVSVSSEGVQGNEISWFPVISADGRYVAFHSSASNLVSNDTNNTDDVFIHNRETSQTTRVSVASNGAQGNGRSASPSVSADGRYIAFESNATNLVADDTNNGSDIFVYDRQMGQTTRVSVASNGVQGDRSSNSPSISTDGRYVAFNSSASTLVSGKTNNWLDVFVHDRQTGQTTRVSVASNGAQGNGSSDSPSISADGRYVAFNSSASTLVSGDTNGWHDVFIHDRQTGQTTRVSVASNGAQSNRQSYSPSISADGRYVAFESGASNLVSGDTNNFCPYPPYNLNCTDIFVHDRQTSQTTRVSISSNGAQGNLDSYGASISADGHYVAFYSGASTLVSDDTNGSSDVFVRDREGNDKLPLVFVHGWSGFPPWGSCEWPNPDTYFESVDNTLRTYGYHVAYAELETSNCYTPHLVDNVPRLRNAIIQAKNATGQSKVILIAHSMGGLVSRAYIEGPDYAEDVAALFTFGSPHHGVPDDLIVFFANGVSLGYYCEHNQPAVCDFSETGMFIFNSDHSRRTNEVVYHLISGDSPFLTRNARGKATDALIGGPDDGITPTDSGLGSNLSGIIDRFQTDENHNIFGDLAYFIRNGGESWSYIQCLKKVLIDKTSVNCGSVSTQQIVAQDTSNLSQRTPFIYGTALAGQTASHSILLEGGATLFVAQWLTGNLTVTLVDPNGQVINPAYAFGNPGIVTYDADTNIATYYLPNAIPGQWQLKLQGSTMSSGSSTYTAFAAFDSTLTLTGGTDRHQYASGDVATIAATLSGSPTNTTVTATILDGHNTGQIINLSFVGGGNYQATYSVPNVPGYAEVRLVATGITAGGVPFERGRSLVFLISSDSGNKIYMPIILK